MNKAGCVPCPTCGRRGEAKLIKERGACPKCIQAAENRSLRLSGHGHKRTRRMHQCKMPKCRKWFRLRKDQDARFTWYCDDCRAEVAEITLGVSWLKGRGIEVPLEEE